MRIEVYTDEGNKFEKDVKVFTVNEQVRMLVLHNHNGTVEAYNIDKLRKFVAPDSEVNFA